MTRSSAWRRLLEYLNLRHPDPSRAKTDRPLGRVVLAEQQLRELDSRVSELERRMEQLERDPSAD